LLDSEISCSMNRYYFIYCFMWIIRIRHPAADWLF
jgi:hypothetical protein